MRLHSQSRNELELPSAFLARVSRHTHTLLSIAADLDLHTRCRLRCSHGRQDEHDDPRRVTVKEPAARLAGSTTAVRTAQALFEAPQTRPHLCGRRTPFGIQGRMGSQYARENGRRGGQIGITCAGEVARSCLTPRFAARRCYAGRWGGYAVLWSAATSSSRSGRARDAAPPHALFSTVNSR